MRAAFVMAAILMLGSSAEAQVIDPKSGDVIAQVFRIAYSASPANPIVAALDAATSPEGQEFRKAIASIWDVPSWVVDLETIQFKEWAKFVQHTFDKGETHAGIIRAPVGYSICTVEHSSPEVSSGSTLNLRLARNARDNGLGWYIVVPHPHAFAAGEDAGISLRISFVKANSEIWSKYADKCQPTDLMIVECRGKHCAAPRIYHGH